MCVCVCVCVCVCMYVCVSMCMCVYVYVCMSVCLHVCMCDLVAVCESVKCIQFSVVILLVVGGPACILLSLCCKVVCNDLFFDSMHVCVLKLIMSRLRVHPLRVLDKKDASLFFVPYDIGVASQWDTHTGAYIKHQVGGCSASKEVSNLL